jgi:tetratricopeptide (TPR) repeat protein
MIHALVLYLAMQAAGAQSAEQHQEAGISALKAGQTDTAILEFKQATELDPKLAKGYLNLGISYMRAGDYGAAIAPLKKALELDPGLTVAHQFLGYALLTNGYATEAVAQFQGTDDKTGMGIAQLEAGDLPNAVQNLHAAATARPNDPDLMYYLARATGLFSKQLYDTLLATYPGTPRANQAAAENYAALRQVQEAEAHYKAALQQRPDLPGVHLALGQLYGAASRWKEAEDEFRAEAKVQPGNAEAAYRLGAALLQDGNAQEARGELERANRLLPDMPETLCSLGKAESMLSNYAAAEKAWNRVVELEKTGDLASQAHFGLAGIYRKQGKTEDAAREMKLFQEAKQPQKQQ